MSRDSLNPAARPPELATTETIMTPEAMTPTALHAWRKRLGLIQSKAAVALGLSLRGYRNYEGGEHPIPLLVALACEALEIRHQQTAAGNGRS